MLVPWDVIINAKSQANKQETTTQRFTWKTPKLGKNHGATLKQFHYTGKLEAFSLILFLALYHSPKHKDKTLSLTSSLN